MNSCFTNNIIILRKGDGPLAFTEDGNNVLVCMDSYVIVPKERLKDDELIAYLRAVVNGNLDAVAPPPWTNTWESK